MFYLALDSILHSSWCSNLLSKIYTLCVFCTHIGFCTFLYYNKPADNSFPTGLLTGSSTLRYIFRIVPIGTLLLQLFAWLLVACLEYQHIYGRAGGLRNEELLRPRTSPIWITFTRSAIEAGLAWYVFLVHIVAWMAGLRMYWATWHLKTPVQTITEKVISDADTIADDSKEGKFSSSVMHCVIN